MREHIVPVLFGLAGIGVGIVMVRYQLTEYEVLISTMNMGLGASILFRQSFPHKDRMMRKSWRLTCGLVEGYNMNNVCHTQEEAERAYADWIVSRGNLPILTGFISPTKMVYKVRNTEVAAIEDIGGVVAEQSIVCEGDLSPKYDQGRSDAEVVETLHALALFMGKRLGQKRVYLCYLGTMYTLKLD